MDSMTMDLQQAPPEEASGDAGIELFVVPASFAQRRLWLLDRMHPGSSAYNVPLALHLRGPLHTAALAGALAALTARHETLRTFFDEEEGEPVQVIVPELHPDLPGVDLSALPADRAEAEARRRMREETARPFDLGRAPLLRSVLFRLREDDHLLVLIAHHIVTDGWSLGLFLRELSALYAAGVAGLPSPLPDLAIQYADFAAWQRDWLQGDVLEQKLRPWRQRLAGAPVGLELSTDRPRVPDGPREGSAGHLSFSLGAALSAEIRQLARSSGCTLFMTLLAGFQALLSRHSGQTDLVVGTPVANRNRLEIEGLVGFFVNTLPLRTDLSGDPGFRQILERVREMTVEAFAHEDFPLEKLVEELRPDRRQQQNPLFPVLFVLQQPHAEPEPGEGGLRWELAELRPATPKLELTLLLIDDPAEIHGSWEYDTGLYDEATIARFSRHLQVLLSDAVAHPERPLSELRLLDADEERLLLVEMNRPLHREDRSWAQTATVHELFLQQAERTPDQIAAVGPQGPMTFRDLAAQASALAHFLQKAAGGPLVDRPVALLADPDPLVLVGILGILQAGGGFVPLDPRHPDERLAWMLEDCSCAALVTQRRHIERAAAIADGLTRPLPIFGLEDAAEAGAMPAPRGVHEPLSLAYIIYTSGSTGRPKGAQNTHEGLAPQLVWGGAHLGLGPKTRVLQHLSFSFDVGIFELLTTLLAGGTLVFPGEPAGDPAIFAGEVLRQDVNTLFITPTSARELAGTGQRLDGLETINVGGEMLSRDTVERLRRVAPRATLHNGYGPSEVSITTAMYSMAPRTGGSESEEALLQSMPVGRPAADNRVYILDRTGRLVPFGARGELCIGGNGVGRGYLDRPDMTAERFLPDPFGFEPGGRLYRSGDLARYLPGGDIEVLGRIDLQVKIRGVRIEPGEVEVVLRDHPAVREVAVAARPDPAGGLRLVAYVVLHRTDLTDPRAELRAFLSQRLPSPMVPSVFVLLGSLPVTVNGKLDRAALPDPDAAAETTGFVAPRTPVEGTLAGIWSSVLRHERIGAFDNFFDLGGHSLTATAVTAKVRSTFQIELPTRAIFREPVLASLAEQIEALLRSREGLELPPIVPRPRPSGAGLPLSFAQQRLWFLDELAGGETPFYNIPAPLLLLGTLDRAALARAFDEIVRRHEALRTTFHTAGGIPVQQIHPHLPLPLPVIDLSALAPTTAEAAAQRLARESAEQPFSLTRGPLLRTALLNLAGGGGSERHVVLLAMHHIVSDGWSLDVFVSELGALYRAFAAGQPSPLPPLPIQYADFAAWQRQTLTGATLERQLAFWRQQLAGVPLVLELPADRPRPAQQTFRARSVPVALPGALTDRLHALARQHRATLFMALLTALAALLRRYTGHRDLLVGSPIANRNRAETAGLIGFFVNLLPFKADLSGDPDFAHALGRVREMALGAYAHQDLPFERLVEELQPIRDLSRHPLFQVGFAMTATPWQALDLPGLSLSRMEVAQPVELYDLTLQVYQTSHGLVAHFSYNADLFEPFTIERMGQALESLLEACAADPGRPVDAVPLLTADERRHLLAAHSLEPVVSPFVTDLVARQAAERPEAPALVWEEGELSYEELDRRANRLAHHLRTLGVGPEVPVALCFDRAVGFGTALLAVWRAGGVAVPLDPETPHERSGWMLADSGARVIVTRAGFLAGVRPDLPRVRLDADRPALARHPVEPPPLTLLPDNAAYVLYTSGSTGTPKGVLVSHAAFGSHCSMLARRLELGPQDRVLQTAAFVFDLSLEEIFSTWIVGAALVPWDSARGPVELSRILAREEITYANIPTPLWHQAAREWASGRVPVEAPHLRYMSVGSEAHPPGSLALWRQTPLASALLLNGYGPTEATVTATVHFGPGPGEEAGADLFRLGIGHPLADRVAVVQDDAGELVPAGIPGELCIGGPSLARGYLGRPDLTAAAFVPDPWSPVPGARLYRTGDLVRRRADGVLDFLGRRDAQLKLRGYRIEAGEVEAALLKHPGVQAAAVALVDRDGTPETRSLVAWYAPVPGAPAPSGNDLREHVRGLLPAYMVPAVCVGIAALPRTASGKLDRTVLPRLAPPYAAQIPAPPPAAPREEPAPVAVDDSLDRLVADLWREALGLAEVGLDDNFFDLGGHSMLLSWVRAKLQEALETDLSMLDMFNAPTIRSLAATLRRDVSPAAPAPRDEPAAAPTIEPRKGTDVAIIGMAGQFPGAANVDALWRNLCQGVESITFFEPGWQPPGGTVFHVPARGVVEGADRWDAAFFGFSAREAEMMDPQHRLFLECSWQALENAGYAPGRCPGPVGVFGGASRDDYLALLVASGAMSDLEGSRLVSLGTHVDFLTSRVSYKLSLEGPSFDVQAACASSMVAVHLACQSLLTGECAMALAGGVAITGQPEAGYVYQKGGQLSSDGHCRAFDARGEGSVCSDGVALVVLKRLDDALADGDHVHAVIKATGINNDGSEKVGFLAPRMASQSRLVRSTLERAGVPAETVGLLEAHGNATPHGDPIEIAALTEAFRAHTPRTGFCALGSLKTNIGHVHGAAGVASLIKAALALEHRLIPPVLHFEKPNPALDLENGPFYVNTRPVAWETNGHPRRAGVSSYGAGGTKVHVVLEEAPPSLETLPSFGSLEWQLLVLSARTAAALDRAAANLASHLESYPDLNLADVAFTLQVGRRHFEHRRAVLCRTHAEALAGLRGQEIRGEESDLLALGRRWLAGEEVDWAGLHAGTGRRRVPLPTYPFEKKRYWVEVDSSNPDIPRFTPPEELRTT